METSSINTKPIPSHGRHTKKKEPRPSKPLKRMSTLSDSINARGIPSTNLRVKDKEVMAASFLQFCAMCEKQITTPSNSLLYCSEACRRKDSVKPLSASLLRPTSMSTPSSPRPALHMRSSSAIVASPNHSSPVLLRIPPDMHGHKSDLDPTEWKPKLGDGHRKTSEAFRYLSQFHQNMNNAFNANADAMIMIPTPKCDTPSVDETKDSLITNNNVQYNTVGSTSTTVSTISTTPSLTSASMSATPTTGPSSFDSTIYAHMHNYNPNYHKTPDYEHGTKYDYDYDFNLRPLPPRQNPMYYSTSAGGGRGIDLVTPHVAPGVEAGESAASSMPMTYDHDFWGKKKVVPVASGPASLGAGPRGGHTGLSSGDGLGALFGKAA
ncbi:hypothetical protein LTR84_003867 [Exophiala bonariae]|uniref:Life-span regulatory factor domain-containing protein n=1 Tax=Exophiala bonariae TaxID=1690606 RepID=A0AAV9N9Z0_9EURO|nr:hypothetical protein LTR84_003867 [Exophiala bonariae]